MTSTNKHDVKIAWISAVKWFIPFFILTLLFAEPLRSVVKRVSSDASELEGFGLKITLQKSFSKNNNNSYQEIINKLTKNELERLLRFQKPEPDFLGLTVASVSDGKLYVLNEFYSNEISNIEALSLVKSSRTKEELNSLIKSLNLPLLSKNDVYQIYDVSRLSESRSINLETYIKLTPYGEKLSDSIYETIKNYWK